MLFMERLWPHSRLHLVLAHSGREQGWPWAVLGYELLAQMVASVCDACHVTGVGEQTDAFFLHQLTRESSSKAHSTCGVRGSGADEARSQGTAFCPLWREWLARCPRARSGTWLPIGDVTLPKFGLIMIATTCMLLNSSQCFNLYCLPWCSCWPCKPVYWFPRIAATSSHNLKWHKTTDFYSPSILEARSLKSRWQQDWLPSESSGEWSFPCSSRGVCVCVSFL